MNLADSGLQFDHLKLRRLEQFQAMFAEHVAPNSVIIFRIGMSWPGFGQIWA